MEKKLIFTIGIFSIMLLKVFAQKDMLPQARSGYALAYDANRGTVVLFGGQDTSSVKLGDTWEWTDGSWKQVKINGPSARINAAMAYDANKKLVFLFGGSSDSGSVNDLWAYDGKSWSKISSSSAPPERQLATMVFDKSQLQMVLFGGRDSKKNALGDTWILKDNAWTELNAKGPFARASHCMTYDDDLGAVFIYGGYVDNGGSKEFWELKDRIWHDLTGNGPTRIHASISYDPDQGRILMFGGFGEHGRTNELWEYSHSKWSMIVPGTNKIPDTRAEHRSVFIPGKGLFVFGGVIGPDPNTRNRGNDTWLYNENSWIRLN